MKIVMWFNPFYIIISEGLSWVLLYAYLGNFKPIQMSHWCDTMVVSCQRLTLLRKDSSWSLIQNLASSSIVYRQCDIRIGDLHSTPLNLFISPMI